MVVEAVCATWDPNAPSPLLTASSKLNASLWNALHQRELAPSRLYCNDWSVGKLVIQKPGPVPYALGQLWRVIPTPKLPMGWAVASDATALQPSSCKACSWGSFLIKLQDTHTCLSFSPGIRPRTLIYLILFNGCIESEFHWMALSCLTFSVDGYLGCFQFLIYAWWTPSALSGLCSNTISLRSTPHHPF